MEDGGCGGGGGRADGAEVVREEGEDEGEVGLAEGGGLGEGRELRGLGYKGGKRRTLSVQ